MSSMRPRLLGSPLPRLARLAAITASTTILASWSVGGSLGCNEACPTDLNFDGFVDGADLGLLLAAWGPGASCADLNGDGTVDGADLGQLLAGWGDCPDPCAAADHDCFTTGGPGCTDPECCAAVCAIDPFCCETAWDLICVGEAEDLCAITACTNNGTRCFQSHPGIKGCGVPAGCCETVCGNMDFAYCCSMGWDSTCVDQACIACSPYSFTCLAFHVPEGESCGEDLNGGCNAPLAASDCCTATGGVGCSDPKCQDTICAVDPFCCDVQWDAICAGEAFEFCASLCAATEHFGAIACGEPICGTYWAEGGFRDSDWFAFELTEAAAVTVTLDASVNADLIVVMPGDEPCAVASGPIVSIPRGCGLTKTITACLSAGSYYVAVAPSAFDGLPCGGADNVYLLAVDCGDTCVPCPPSDHDCYTTGGIGCTDLACCEAVCAVDPFCCETAWDGACVSEALLICELPPCEFSCSEGATAEPEPCGSDTNGGCNPPNNPLDPALTAIACGETICGSAWAQNGTRDTDWYRLTGGPDGFATLFIVAELPMVIGRINAVTCASATAFDPFAISSFCGAAEISFCHDGAEAWLFAGPNAFDGFPCGESNGYEITVSCSGVQCSGNTCCYPSGGLGCEDAACTDCVCAADAFCCDVAWDGLCAESAGPGGICGASCPCGG